MAQGLTKSINFLDRSLKLAPQISKWRRAIHANPELSFQEIQTARLVATTLKNLGYVVEEGIGKTGIVAEIGKGRIVGIRADMDALPIKEDTGASYCSRNENVMHACGHDAHTAMALAAATMIADLHKEKMLSGAVRFIFQPSEESVDENGKSGAMLMLDEGAVNELEGLFSLHVDPRQEKGLISVRAGALLAACDSFKIKINGRGGHGAYPEAGVDAVVLTAQVIQALQTVVSRRKSAIEPAVLTIGGIRSNTFAPNILVGEVELVGTARYFGEGMSDKILEEIKKACDIANALGGSYTIEYRTDNPCLYNDPQISNVVRIAAAEMLGKENIKDAHLELGADDFCYFSGKVPSCYFLLGAKAGNETLMLHSANFDINEEAMPIGAAILAASACKFLA